MKRPTTSEYLFKTKTIYKTLTWRIISVVLGFAVSAAMGASSSQATKFTIVFNGTAMIAYYIHELVYRYIKYLKKYRSKANGTKVLQKLKNK